MNTLIVESENDQYFIEALARKINTENTVCFIDKFKHSSLDERNLTKKISSALVDANRGLSKLGIVLDLDSSSVDDRIDLINECLTKALIDSDWEVPETLLTRINEFIRVEKEGQSVEIACHFTNVGGEGELETLLKSIATQNSDFADCLMTGWRKCIESKKKKVVKRGEPGDISEKEILKLWVDFYKRLDTLKKSERNQENTNWRGIMLGLEKDGKPLKARGEDIFDLDSPVLNDLNIFLKMFN